MAQARFYYRNPDAPQPNQPTSLGVVAIIERDGCLLMEKRSDSDRWAIIGGAMHAEESLLEALVREVKEETGLTVISSHLMGTFSDPSRIIAFQDGRIKRIVTVAYRVEVEHYETLAISEESIELKFIPALELLQLPIAETHLPIIHAYLGASGVTLA
jgi:8-oxo-dGTP pyrophosphatase MutT (NUDIX family)